MEAHPHRCLNRCPVLRVRLPLYPAQPQPPILRQLQAVLKQKPDHVGGEVRSLVPWERDNESDLDTEVHRRSVQESDYSRWGGVRFKDLVVRGIDDGILVLLDSLCEPSSKSFLRGIEGPEGEETVEFGVIFCVIPVPVVVNRRLYVVRSVSVDHFWSMSVIRHWR